MKKLLFTGFLFLLASFDVKASTDYYLPKDPGARVLVTEEFWQINKDKEKIWFMYLPSKFMWCGLRGFKYQLIRDLDQKSRDFISTNLKGKKKLVLHMYSKDKKSPLALKGQPKHSVVFVDDYEIFFHSEGKLINIKDGSETITEVVPEIRHPENIKSIKLHNSKEEKPK